MNAPHKKFALHLGLNAPLIRRNVNKRISDCFSFSRWRHHYLLCESVNRLSLCCLFKTTFALPPFLQSFSSLSADLYFLHNTSTSLDDTPTSIRFRHEYWGSGLGLGLGVREACCVVKSVYHVDLRDLRDPCQVFHTCSTPNPFSLVNFKADILDISVSLPVGTTCMKRDEKL